MIKVLRLRADELLRLQQKRAMKLRASSLSQERGKGRSESTSSAHSLGSSMGGSAQISTEAEAAEATSRARDFDRAVVDAESSLRALKSTAADAAAAAEQAGDELEDDSFASNAGTPQDGVLVAQHISGPLASRVSMTTKQALNAGRIAEIAIGKAALASSTWELAGAKSQI